MNGTMPCALCHQESRDVRSALVRLKVPTDPRFEFERLPRCTDHDACRDRVEAKGEIWPVLEESERRLRERVER